MLLFTGLHVWQGRRDPHQAAPIPGFQIHAETGMSVEGCAWDMQNAPLCRVAGKQWGAVRLLRAPVLIFPQSHIRDAAEPPTGSGSEPCPGRSPLGGRKDGGSRETNGSLQGRFTSSLCLSSCRQSRWKRSSMLLIPFLSFFPSFPWETQDTCVSSHQEMPPVPFLSTDQKSSPWPMPCCSVSSLGLDW